MMIVANVILALSGLAVARVQFIGVSIANGDSSLSAQSGDDTEAQLKHFSKDNMMNLFRLPVSSQFLLDSKPNSPLNTANLAIYDRLVQSCLATGASCLLEVHSSSYSSNSSSSIPTNSEFISLWTQLAAKYASSSNILFELCSLSSAPLNTTALQATITAIRSAGATSQIILLPIASPQYNSSLSALSSLKNPDSSTTNIHLTLSLSLSSSPSSSSECTTNNTALLTSLASTLLATNRRAILTSSSPPGNPLCLVRFCEQNAFINANSNVFLGLVVGTGAGASKGAGASSLDSSSSSSDAESSYLLSQTPVWEGGRFVDNPLMAQCVVGTWIASTVGVTALLEISEPEDTASAPGNTAGRSWSSRQAVPAWFLSGVACAVAGVLALV